jgi:hypothetical protein
MTTTAPTPSTASEDLAQRQLKAFFEQTKTLPQLLATLRSRRVAMGYQIEGGEEETSLAGRRLHQPKGPLAFVSEHAVVPLTEVEEAIVAWSACVPNGMAHWDIASTGGFHELVGIAGRTAASPGNSFATDLLVIKDEGAFVYNPGSERERMVEIQGEEDYHKILDWYRAGMRKIMDGRPDVDWALRVPGAPNASLFGPYQYNVNRPGTTWFIPITDHGWLYFSVMLNIFDAWHIYLTDDKTGEPAGTGAWVGEGQLEFPITISQFEQFIFQVETYPPGSMVQNMRLAAESMGLGNWIFCGFFDDVLMGAFPDVARGLGFQHEPLNERAPAVSGAQDVRYEGCEGGNLHPVGEVPGRPDRRDGDDGGEVRHGADDVEGRRQLDAYPRRTVYRRDGPCPGEQPAGAGQRLGSRGLRRLLRLLRADLRPVPCLFQPDAMQLRCRRAPCRPAVLRDVL